MSTRRGAAFLVLAASLAGCGGPGPRKVTALAAQTPAPTDAPASPGSGDGVTPPPEVMTGLRSILQDPRASVTMTAAERRFLTQAYRDEGPWWIGANGGPNAAADEAVRVLRDAAVEGLHPADYRTDELTAAAGNLGTESRGGDAARFDLQLSLTLMRYLRHLHRGHANPRDFGFQVTLPVDEHDYARLARDAAHSGQIRRAATAMEPPLVQYRLLRAELPAYRALAEAEGRTIPALGPAPRKSWKLGDREAGLVAAKARLAALGDLTPSVTPASDADPTLFDAALAEAVRRFQSRHGYEADGVLGRTTWAALATPFSWRLRQIELAMERMRWLPHLGERPFVAVNIPMFRLFVWDKVPASGAPDFSMGVIVGKALNTRTPVFVEEMEYLIFRPYWNVPRSILHKEILPILRRNLGYLDREDMEMVLGQGDDARPMAAMPENVDRLAAGELRLRQRPGRRNSLGLIKFMFPNDENVYLHGTPAVSLFGRARRDFSHGCVRVEDPPKLAQWVLRDQPKWTTSAIEAAMAGAPSFRVNLKQPLRVVMYYVTAAVMPEDGTVHFADDIYKQDAPLDRALQALHRPGAARY